MPQIVVWPFMARTMVEDVHGVKPLPGPANRPPGTAESSSIDWG
jgi:hypothetical protein